MDRDAVASQITTLAKTLVAPGHLARKRLLSAVPAFVGLEISQLAEPLATGLYAAEIGLFAAVGADVDEQMSALGERLVALAVGARVFLCLGWRTVELSGIRGGCR